MLAMLPVRRWSGALVGVVGCLAFLAGGCATKHFNFGDESHGHDRDGATTDEMPAHHCDDGIACTIDSGDLHTGCSHVPDHDACEPPADACLSAFCDPAVGCATRPTAEGLPCSGSHLPYHGVCRDGACVAFPGDLYRMVMLELVDPHIVANIRLPSPAEFCSVCADVTHVKGLIFECFGFEVWVESVNSQLNRLLREDTTGDGYIDQTFFLAFDRDGSSEGGGELMVTRAQCRPDTPDRCDLDHPETITTVAPFEERSSGDCSLVLPDTLGPLPYPDDSTLEPFTPEAPCFVRGPTTLDLLTLGQSSVASWRMEVHLEDVEIAGEWFMHGDYIFGVIRGFLPMDVADQTEASAYVSLLNTEVVYNLGRDALPDDGSAHGCDQVERTAPSPGTAGFNTHCAGGDSRDLRDPSAGPSYSNCGWWIYLNFAAERI